MNGNEKISIYVCQHDRYPYLRLIKDPIYVPLFCGKDLFVDVGVVGDLPELADNTGCNISIKNRKYCELTGLYWAWKNDLTSDILGLCHYRRYFKDPYKDTPISRESILEMLDEVDCICLGPDSNESNPACGHRTCIETSKHEAELNYILDVTRERYPYLYDEMSYQLRHTSDASMRNMFITTRNVFMQYCEWLFDVLAAVEFKFDPDPNSTSRLEGYFGEWLLRPWLVASGYTFKSYGLFDWERYVICNAT